MNLFLNPFKQNSLRTHFTMMLTAVITIVVIMLSIVSIFYNSQKLEKQLKERVEKITAFSQESLSVALWQYNYDYINKLADSFYLYEDVVYTSVKIKNRIIAQYIRSSHSKNFDEYKKSANFIMSETQIFHKDIKVGDFQLVVSKDRIKKLILNTSLVSIFILIAINFAIFGTNYFMTNKYLFKPISKLKNSVKKVSTGDLDAQIDTTGNDEIAKLAISFKTMISNLKIITASRDELNQEIQRRMRIEGELRKERDRAQNYLDISGVMMLALDRDAKVTLVNEKGCKILGLPEDKVLGKEWFKNFIPEHEREKVKTVFEQTINGEKDLVEYFENEILTGENERRFIAWHNTDLKNEDGQIIGTLSSGEDITERKKDENKIKNSLKEKEILLREIHHRVKNNMQIILSLLSLQSEQIEDEKYKKLLIDSNNRIKSMSLIHETIYRSKDVARLDIENYFNDIFQHLLKIYYNPDLSIKSQINIEPVNLNLDLSIACGLILNELVSNALKYAFISKHHGTILITLKKTDKSKVVLTLKLHKNKVNI